MHVNTNSDMDILKNGEETFPRIFEELKKQNHSFILNITCLNLISSATE